MSTIAIKYVGRKPFTIDNVARSGKAWNGLGDVQDVTEAQAKILLMFPDQWAVANPEDTPITKSDEAPKIPLEKMNRNQLVAYAHLQFGKVLDPVAPRKILLDEIEELARTMDPLKTAPETAPT
jgi:hypothetical protein